MGSKQATVYLNNRRLSSDEIAIALNNLHAKDISEIEVQSTHGGEYGVDIQGGVIHIKTVKNRTGFNAATQFYAAYPKSDYYTLSPNLNLFFGKEKWNIYSSYSFNHGKGGSYSETTNHYNQNNITHEASGEFKNKPNSHTYKIGSLWDINKDHTISFEFNGISNNPGRSSSFSDINLLEEQVLIDRAKSEKIYSSNSDFYNVALYHEWKIDTLKSNLKTLLNYNNKQSYSDNIINSRYELLHDKNIFEQNSSTADANNYSLKSDLRKNWASSLSLRAGIQYSYSKRKSDLKINNPDSGESAYEQWTYNEGIAGAYIGLSRNIGNVYLYGNIRVEHTYIEGKSRESKTLDKNYTEIYPYITLNHTLKPKLSYGILYTKYIYRPPFNLMNNYSNRVSDVLYDVGNPDLKPQNTHTGQISLNYGSHSTSFEINYTPDAITEFFEERNEITYHTNLNFGSVTRLGINHNFNSNIFKWWYTNLYIYVGYEHIPKSYNKKELFRGFINSNNRFSIPAVGDIQFSFNYNSGNINGNAHNKRNYGMDISYGRSFSNNSANIQLGVSDIFNTRYYRSRNYVPTLEYLFYSKPLSRNFWIRLTYNFNTKEKVNKQRLNNQNSIINRL
ncbi:outer membrane beta-barrel family protein [Bacteroides neonati]|uniref:outer membrane beta-barrel family protein n=1 Tax=Bacteroides neonati TaxID=1347393 RepID=UPI0004BCF6AE|nr:outer membrane beta-barrel family protein [Bacteroides neonati]